MNLWPISAAWVQFRVLHKLSILTHAGKPRTRDLKAVWSEMQGLPPLSNKIEASLKYMRPCHWHTDTQSDTISHTHTYSQTHWETVTHIHTETDTYTQRHIHSQTHTHRQAHTKSDTHSRTHTVRHTHTQIQTHIKFLDSTTFRWDLWELWFIHTTERYRL